MQISKYQIYMSALVAAIVIICFGIVLYGTRNVKKEINQEETETVIESETCASQQVKTSGRQSVLNNSD